ncbi:MAG: polyprenyl synthetase family protein [Alphaproteobacteria bacterium]|nr:polyprenyl synthetase family protein [Alphaproteobacteria bacterium]
MSEQWRCVEDALERWVPADAPAGLGQSMRYAVLEGGKRLRPMLVLAARRAVADARPEATLDEAALRAACAIELIHAYSLVHDDMPCMDNDVLRRGKPTVHVQFGQAQALLAGDALQALAFEVLTPCPSAIPDGLQGRLCAILARAAGHAGMAGGQAIDLASVGQDLDDASLRQMHRMKTGALLQASIELGAACGSESSVATGCLIEYGRALGVAFQVIDDILDVTADSTTLGKTAGKDAANDKPTYVSIMGLERSRRYADELLQQALQVLGRSGLRSTDWLADLAMQVVGRNH